MLDMQRIRDNPEGIQTAINNKKCQVSVQELLSLDSKRRDAIKEVERLKSLRNERSLQIASLKKEKKDAASLIDEMKQVSETIKVMDTDLGSLEARIQEIMSRIPNVCHESVPHGNSEKDNVEVFSWGSPIEHSFPAKDHLQLATDLDILDFPRGAKITGAGFPVYKGYGAALERALITFFLDMHTRNHGYLEIFPPFLANKESHFGTGQLPKSQDQMYYIGEDDLYCIPTAEVPVTNLHRDETLDISQLPIKYCAYSACFRREAGSYGKDTKGFLRVHQFNKVELVKFVKPEESYDEHEKLRKDAEAILQALGLHYRVISLCDADLSFSAAKCYDLEAWAPVEKKFLEVSSCSNFEDFQARRANIRFRSGSDKPRFVHTLNGSGLATSRIFVALLETYQTERGTIKVPEVLQPYMHGLKEIGPR